MKHTMTNFLESLFDSNDSNIKTQAKSLYTSLELANLISQSITRFEKGKPKFTDLEIGFNNYKLAQDFTTNLALAQLAKLNSLLAINHQSNLFDKISDQKQATKTQLVTVAEKFNSYLDCNDIDHQKIINQGFKTLAQP